jgi:hypothetical protein
MKSPAKNLSRLKGGSAPGRRAARLLVAAIVAYISSYAILSRMGLKQAAKEGIDGYFLYVPCSMDRIGNSRALTFIHITCCHVFYPIWVLDNAFGGPVCLDSPPQVGFSNESNKEEPPN